MMTVNIFHINQNFTARGEWWDAKNPKLQYSGQLTYRNRRIKTLLVSGIFPELSTNPRGPEETSLYGQTYNGMCITVVDPMISRTRGSKHPKGSTTNFHATEFLVGPKHIQKDENIFTSCVLELSGFTKWLKRKAFVQTDDGLSKTPLESIEIPLPSIEGKIIIWRGGTETHGPLESTFKHKEMLSIEFENPKNYAFFKKIAFDLSILFSLLTGNVANINNVVLRSESDNTSQRRPDLTHYIFYSNKDKYTGSTRHYTSFIEWDFLLDEAPDFIDRWLSLSQDQMRIARSVHHSRTGSTTFVEDNLLTIAAGLEKLGADLAVNKLIEQAQWKELKLSLHDAVETYAPTEVQCTFKAKISSLNNSSLQSVLFKILEKIDSKAANIIQYHDADYVSKFVKTRNSLVHPPEADKRPHKHDMSKNINEIVKLAEITEHIILHNILVKLGVSEDYLLSRYRGVLRLADTFHNSPN